MHRIDNPSAAPQLPTPIQQGTPGYFTGGSPTTGLEATIVEADWMNAVQEELSFVIETSGLTLDKTDRTQLAQAIARLTRLRVQQNFVLYVSPTGSDSNSGFSPATPMLTPAHAYNFIRDRVDLNGFAGIILLADGHYGGVNLVGPPNGGVIMHGNSSDPSKVVIENLNGSAVVASEQAMIQVQWLTLRAAGAGTYFTPGGDGLFCWSAYVSYSNVVFDTCANFHMNSQLGGYIGPVPNAADYTIIGGASAHILSANGGITYNVTSRVTILNNPLFSNAFVVAASASVLNISGCTFTGSARGLRYNANTNGVINTTGAGVNYLPGDAAGVVSTGGVYI